MRPSLLAFASVVAWPALAHAEASAPPPPMRLGVEVDPSPFFSHGFSAHVELKPLSSIRLTFGAFGSKASLESGDNAGFTAETRAAELSVQDFVWSWSTGGLFAGVYCFFERREYSRTDSAPSAVAYWLVPAPAIGLQWLPWKEGPYVAPWVALGFPIRRGRHQVGSHAFVEPGIVSVLGLHIGYEFAL